MKTLRHVANRHTKIPDGFCYTVPFPEYKKSSARPFALGTEHKLRLEHANGRMVQPGHTPDCMFDYPYRVEAVSGDYLILRNEMTLCFYHTTIDNAKAAARRVQPDVHVIYGGGEGGAA